MNLVEMFTATIGKLRFPRVVYPHQGGRILFTLASKHADKDFKNLIYIKWENASKQQFYLGYISKQNEMRITIDDRLPIADKQVLHETLNRLHTNPLEQLKMHGQQYSHCCFCATTIVSKNSLAVGYGPICAEKFGLPWEGMGEAAAREAALADMQADTLHGGQA